MIWKDNGLNNEQKKAVLHAGNVFLTACPGSGKTRALTYKIAHELSSLKSTKKYVVAITYTNRAADEIHERVEDMGVNTNQLWIGTIHSFCLEWIIKPYAIYNKELSHGYKLINSHDSEFLFSELCKPYSSERISPWDCQYVSTPSGYRLTCENKAKHGSLVKILNAYFKILSKNRKIDFEMILHFSYKLVSSNNAISLLLSNLFQHILIDEYQDTKEIQYCILSTIIKSGEGKTNVFIVGDPNQAIYTSLGGYPISAKDFSDMCSSQFSSFNLKENYRSSEKIVAYFKEYNVHGTVIEAASKHKDYPSRISFNSSIHKNAMPDEIIRLLKINIEDYGISPSSICILAPQWIHLASMTRLLVSRVPEYDFDGPGMVPFARDIENFWYKLSKIALTTSSPKMYVRRLRWARDILNELSTAGIDLRGLDHKKLLRISNSIKIDETEGLRYLDRFFNTFFDDIKVSFRRVPFLVEHHNAFFGSAQTRISKLAKEGNKFIEDISTFRKVFKQKEGITISTIHGVKGAEFDTVIAYALLDGMVPHFNDPDPEDSAKKLLYVISSRARKNIHLISERGMKYNTKTTPALSKYSFQYDKL